MKALHKKDFVRAKINRSMSPGDMLKVLRELQGLSQKKLSELCGIPQSNISAIESNQRQIGRERALALAKALKVHPAVILFPNFDSRDVA